MECPGRGDNEAKEGMDASIKVFASVVPVQGSVPLFARVEQGAVCPGIAIGCMLHGDGPAQRKQRWCGGRDGLRL